MSELVADGSRAVRRGRGVVWLPNALEHNPPANPYRAGLGGDNGTSVPRCSLKSAAYQVLRA